MVVVGHARHERALSQSKQPRGSEEERVELMQSPVGTELRRLMREKKE